MRRYIKCFLFFLIPAAIFPTDVLVAGKAAYFYPTSSRFKDIYSGGGIYGAEMSVQAWKELYPWISADYFPQNGRSIIQGGGKGNRTIVKFVPLALGLKYLTFVHKSFDVY